MMMSPSVSPGESPTEQARNAGVYAPPVHVAPSDAAIVGPHSSRRHLARRLKDFIDGRRERGPDQLSPDDSSSIRRPPPVQRRPMDSVGGRRDENGSPDLFSPSSSSRRPRAAPAEHWWLVIIGFCFLTYNSGMAIYQARGDTGSISFVASAYLTMVSLFFTIKKFQAAPPNSRRRRGLMVGVWIFTMSLVFGFVYQIIGTAAKPTLNLTLLLWAMPAGTGISASIIFWDRSDAHLGEELLDV